MRPRRVVSGAAGHHEGERQWSSSDVLQGSWRIGLSDAGAYPPTYLIYLTTYLPIYLPTYLPTLST